MSAAMGQPTGVLVVTMDGTLDLNEVSWQTLAPCGCVSGVMLANMGDELIVTAEQAASHGTTPAEVERDNELGFSWRPRERRAAVAEMTGSCEHTPKWGVVPMPKPEGFVWAANAHGSRVKFSHLAPSSAVVAWRNGDYSGIAAAPLCGGKSAWAWSDEWHHLDGRPECKKCIAKGNELAAKEVAA